jgi:heat shock protein HtpX
MRFSAYLRFALLFAVLTLFLLLVGYIVSFYLLGVPSTGVLFVMLGISLVMNIVSYLWGPSMILKFSHARIMDPNEFPSIHSMLDELSRNAGIPSPKLALVDQPQPNAFTTGRSKSNSVIVVTSGLLRVMNNDELKAVLGHEVGHVVHRDMALATAAATVATTITYMADILFFSLLFGGGGGGRRSSGGGAGLFAALLAPVAATMVQLSISRGREFYADEESAKLTGRPDYLMSALRKIEEYVRRGVPLNVSPSTSSLWISNPFRGSFSDIFSTHPATEKRIRNLSKLARKMGILVS